MKKKHSWFERLFGIHQWGNWRNRRGDGANVERQVACRTCGKTEWRAI